MLLTKSLDNYYTGEVFGYRIMPESDDDNELDSCWGFYIAPTKITDFAPLYCDEEGKHPVTQFDKSDVEYAGLVKFDFLGLRTLTIINWALEMINKRRAKNGEPPLDIAAIPLDDKKSFDMLQRSETTAVFQLESRGMKGTGGTELERVGQR